MGWIAGRRGVYFRPMSKVSERENAGRTSDSLLSRGLSAYARRDWEDAFTDLSAADELSSLSGDDLEALAWSAAMTGRDDGFLETVERLHNEAQASSDTAKMARTAFWMAMRLIRLREFARAGGWQSRLQGLLADRPESLEHGYVQILQFHRALEAGNIEQAHAAAAEGKRIGLRFGDPDLTEFCRNLEGRILIRLGKVSEGLAMLDEAMLAATAGRLSPMLITQNPRLARALSTAAALAGWDGGGRGSNMGLAAHSAFGSHAALVLEASVGEDQRIRVSRAVCAVDCGRVINPDIVRQLVEGGIVYGIAGATGHRIAFERGLPSVRSLRAMGFQRLADAPEIIVEIIESQEEPGGVTELAVPVVAPAIANAIFAATGQRLRSLPLAMGRA
jgi:hypothetical protein